MAKTKGIKTRQKAAAVSRPKRLTGPASLGAKDDSREALIRAAKTLFASRGYDGTSVRDIADKAGVNLSLVSYHFAGKEGLYQACIEPYGQAKLATTQRILKEVKSADELRIRLEMFFEAIIQHYLDAPEISRIVHRECNIEMRVTEDLFRRTFLSIFALLEQFFKSAQQAGYIRKGLDPQTPAKALIWIINSLIQLDWVGERFLGQSLKDPGHRQKTIAETVQVLISGIISPTHSDLKRGKS